MLPIAVGQSTKWRLTLRYREQAPSHIGFCVVCLNCQRQFDQLMQLFKLQRRTRKQNPEHGRRRQ